MMSISVIQSSAKQAADYYMNEEKNYYSQINIKWL